MPNDARVAENPDTLETYARIFELPRKVDFRRPDGRVEWCMVPASEACLAAAKALRFMARAALEQRAPGETGTQP